MSKINIAIDGPAGAGKSTIARKVAKELSYIYVDTGAMYRAVTWKLIEVYGEKMMDIISKPSSIHLADWLQTIDIQLVSSEDGQLVVVDGKDISIDIRSSKVTNLVAQVARMDMVRDYLVKMQKQMSLHKGVVMDGRDIGTTVIPDAEIKIYLTASIRERALRRINDQYAHHHDQTLEQLEQEIARRDQLDQQRLISPLIRAQDATFIDSTNMTIEDVVKMILELHQSKIEGGR